MEVDVFKLVVPPGLEVNLSVVLKELPLAYASAQRNSIIDIKQLCCP